MKTTLRALTLGLLLSLAPMASAEATPDQITASIHDDTRPADDRERDTARHASELLAFSQVKAGDNVVDFLPGGGYFTRLFSNLVGPTGKVGAFVPSEAADKHDMGTAAKGAVEGRANARAVIEPLLTPGLTDVDVFWTSQNYHDLHTPMVKVDIAAFNKMVFDALKPGGVYIVVDHAAAAGADVPATADSLHRIDPAVVKAEVEAAGFVFDEESKVLANPEDDHSKLVFDPAIRGKTDQFAYRFRKPK